MFEDEFVSEEDDDEYPTVPRIPPRCPRCNVNRSRLTGQSRDGVIRYHRCQACGQKFKSVEIDPPGIEQKN